MGRLLFKAFVCASLASAVYVFWLPDVTLYRRKNPATTAYIELQRRRHPELKIRQAWVSWDDISENLTRAVLVAEDDTFYRHHGVDWDGIRAALQRDWELKSFAYGASTITQQVARNLYLSPSKNPLRKLKELLIARRLERDLGKRRIFELYLNVAEWGKGIYGCEAAAQAYFGKHASELSIDEAVAMAVVLPSPRRHDPAKRGKYVERNSERVLGRMRASGLLPEDKEKDEPLDAQFAVLASSGALGGDDAKDQGEQQDAAQQEPDDRLVPHTQKSQDEPRPIVP